MIELHRSACAWTGLVACLAIATFSFTACSGDDEGDLYEADTAAPVAINSTAPPNAVAQWSELAAATINGTGTANSTPEEQRPVYSADLATVHLAIYDALMAITGTHLPYASAAQAPQASASQAAAAAAAAYRVLSVLFPNRSALYQPAYDSAVAAVADGDAKTRGLAIGTAAANAVLNLRLNDGRSIVLAAYVPGSGPGQFRGTNPVNQFAPYVRPFALHHAAQFRPAGPPALTSIAYEQALAETRALGSATSSTRTAAQTDTARFHTDAPPRFWPRNMRPLANRQASLSEAARLMALLWVAQADATIACFEAKYFYHVWRPASAITLADTDGNPNTAADTTWTPVLPTPNHPEYPAAHACAAGAVAEVVRVFHQTRQVSFTFDSQAAGLASNRRDYASTDAMIQELQEARIWGGMHFRTSSADGAALGKAVARWVLTQRLQPRQ